MKKLISVSAAAVAACCMVVSGGVRAINAQAEEKLASVKRDLLNLATAE